VIAKKIYGRWKGERPSFSLGSWHSKSTALHSMSLRKKPRGRSALWQWIGHIAGGSWRIFLRKMAYREGEVGHRLPRHCCGLSRAVPLPSPFHIALIIPPHLLYIFSTRLLLRKLQVHYQRSIYLLCVINHLTCSTMIYQVPTLFF
jgi:hypothetical protein